LIVCTALLLLAAPAACSPAEPARQAAGHPSCQSYDQFGARLSVSQCAGIDRPEFGIYHQYPPAWQEPTGVGSHQ